MATPFDAAAFLLKAVAVLCGLALLSSRCSVGSRSPGRTFVRSAAFLLILYFLHLLSEASIRVPNGRQVHRLECLHSGKGGKRPLGDTSAEYRNPCFNATSSMPPANETSSLCPSHDDDSSTNEPYISASRDCIQAQTGECTLSQPCTPCELSRRDEFRNHGWSRCQACTIRNNFGACNFVDGVGPYCFKEADSEEVTSCKTCCTEGVPMFDEDGVCY